MKISAVTPARLDGAEAFGRLRYLVHQRLLRNLEQDALSAQDAAQDLPAQLDRALSEVSTHESVALTADEQGRIRKLLADDLLGLGPLTDLMLDPNVSDILVNGPHEIWTDCHGRLQRTRLRFDDEAHLRRILNRLVASLGKQLDAGTPAVDARMPDGSRLHAVIPPLSPRGALISIRRFRRDSLDSDSLLAQGCLSAAMLDLLVAAVAAGQNIVIAGGGGAGKTTLLNVLASHIPASERVVLVEDLAELDFAHPHVVRLEARAANQEGRGDIRLRDLVRNALRMRADRIIVGEVRGDEVLDMLQAMNVGHDGSLTTVHANSASQALLRLETLALLAAPNLSREAVSNMIAGAVQWLVHIVRLRDGRRCVTSISELRQQDGQLQLDEHLRRDPTSAKAGERVG